MNTCTINDFTPFPGNYFSYVFNEDLDFNLNESISIYINSDPNIAVEAKVLQKIRLGQEIKVQFKVIQALKKESKDFQPVKVIYDKNKVDNSLKNKLKELLINWDKSEFSDPKNHYFKEIDKDIDLKKFVELIGGCINRPNKFPFNSDELKSYAIKKRLSVLSATDGKEQLSKMIEIISKESLN